MNASDALLEKLWIYTNYDCNLSCSYCVAESTPHAPRRALSPVIIERLIDEAVAIGFRETFFTGGEPLVLDGIYDILRYSTQAMKTCVLTNAMLVKGARLERLKEIQHPNLIIQASLDGGRAEHHDAYRGKGTWTHTMEGIENLLKNGFRVRLSTTQTPANAEHMDELCAFHLSLGIPEEDHVIRPLAKRGFSKEGIELNLTNLNPEVTVNVDGVFWHPLSTDADMKISCDIFPLAAVVDRIREQLQAIANGGTARIDFT